MIRKPDCSPPGPRPFTPPSWRRWRARSCTIGRTSSARIFKECIVGLKPSCKTEDDVLILACSGTGGMEAALVNVLGPATGCSPWWPETSASAGPTSARRTAWTCRSSRRAWETRCRPRKWRGRSTPIPSIKAVFVQLRTSPRPARATTSKRWPDHARPCRDAPRRGRDLRRRRHARWRRRPGASTWWWSEARRPSPCPRASPSCPVSARGWERIESAKSPRFYFDLRRERKAQAGGESAFTPAISTWSRSGPPSSS